MLHLLGFMKPWKLAALPQLTGDALIPLSEAGARVVGLLWLVAALALLAAWALWLLRQPSFWFVAGAGVVLSQALIVLQWQDAKAGTIANILLVALLALVAVHVIDASGRNPEPAG